MTERAEQHGISYASAGVDIEAGDRAVILDDGSVQVLDAAGESLDRLRRPGEIVALDLSATHLTLLDDSGRVVLHGRGPDGLLIEQPLFEVAGYHGARGIVLDGEGGAWIADTDRHRLVHLGPDGRERGVVGGGV